MFDDFMNGGSGLLDGAKEDLLNIRKNTEKMLIHTWTASRSCSTSEDRKLLLKEMKRKAIQDLKKQSTNLSESFSTSAKGQWVDKTTEVMKEASEQLDQLG